MSMESNTGSVQLQAIQLPTFVVAKRFADVRQTEPSSPTSVIGSCFSMTFLMAYPG